MNSLMTSALNAIGATPAAPGARVFVGDCLDLMRKLPTESVNLVSADPPYFLSNGGTTNHGGKRVSVEKGVWDRSQGVRANFDFHRRWLGEIKRVLHPEGTAWISGTQHCIFQIGYALELLDWRTLNTVVWEKTAPPPNLHQRTLSFSHEMIIWASPNHDEPQRHLFNYDVAKDANDGKQMKDVWRINAPSKDEKQHGKHAAQKPVELLRRIIQLTTKLGDIVFDPFMGSGTAGVAALELGREFIGAELDAANASLAARRLAEVRRESAADPLDAR